MPAYDRAIALSESRGKPLWSSYFYRGICQEQLRDWAKAEPDFRKALDAQSRPRRSVELPWLFLVEQNENLDEALDLIKRAVEASPESGYIVDSLGWAYYRLGRYDDAVDPMERAVELTPTDAVI